jgi:two-component system, response regulator
MQQAEDKRHKKVDTSRLSVSVVEDDPDDREFICAALEDTSSNLNIAAYKSGSEFLKYLSATSQPPQLVLTDIRMPVVSGFDVIRAVKSDARHKHIPVVVISTSANPEDMSAAKELGASGYYVKPFSMQEYSNITSKILSDLQDEFKGGSMARANS